MGLFTKDIETLDDLFVHTLQDIYYAENQILKALPKMIKKASDPQLRRGAFRASRADQDPRRAAGAGLPACTAPRSKRSTARRSTASSRRPTRSSATSTDKQVLDAAIIAAAQAVEHYEITRYGTLATWAKQLGREDCASVLVETLEEEKEADEILTDVAKGRVNAEAACDNRHGWTGPTATTERSDRLAIFGWSHRRAERSALCPRRPSMAKWWCEPTPPTTRGAWPPRRRASGGGDGGDSPFRDAALYTVIEVPGVDFLRSGKRG